MGKSALWSIRYSIAQLVNIQQILGNLGWVRLDLHVPHQEQTNWCWAATSDGVSHCYDTKSTWTQCAIANTCLGRTDCCGSGASGPCNVYGYLDRALTAVGHYERLEGQPAAFAAMTAAINGVRPVGVRVAWSGGGAHFVAIGGYQDAPQYVHVEDPWYGPSDIPYATLEHSYQGIGTWTTTYWTKP